MYKDVKMPAGPGTRFVQQTGAGGPQVSVGDVVAGDANVVCLQEASKSGTTFSIADVATGANAGTYYTKGTCSTTDTVVKGWGNGW